MGTGKLSIRAMTRGDLDRVLEIEHAVFPAPWSRRSFEAELAHDFSVQWVAELGGSLVGYLMSWLVADELHIGNVAVAPVAQRQGVGRELMRFSLEDAEARGIAYATLEVRVSNERAIGLYRALGFSPVAMRRAYYSDTGEDALVMMKHFADDRRTAA